MSEERNLLLLARFGRDERRALLAEAAAAACELQSVDSLEAALLSLAAHPPPAVLVDLALEDAEKLCRKVRARRRAVDVAIFGLTSTITEPLFAKALAWGVDDVVSPLVEGAIATRLVALPLDPTVPVAERGDAIVAARDESENLVGRMLTNAGFQVEYATDPTSLLHLAASERIRLVVASPDLGSPRDHVTATRRRGGNATWIVLGRPPDVTRLEREIAGLPRVAVVSLADALDHILFVSNELGMADTRADRRERRILHGTLCAFCPVGATTLEHGFTYNVSPSGLYVRTLSPPREDHVRIDVLAPGTEQPVRLEGQIAWRRGFGRLGTATAPPGFGVRLTGGELEDRTTWARACTALLVSRAAPAKPRASGSEPPAAPAIAPPRPRGATLLGMGLSTGSTSASPGATAAPTPTTTPPGPPVALPAPQASPATPAATPPGPPVATPTPPLGPDVSAMPAALGVFAVPAAPAPGAAPPSVAESDTPTPLVPVAAAALDASAAAPATPTAAAVPRTEGGAAAPTAGLVPSDLPSRRESEKPSLESRRTKGSRAPRPRGAKDEAGRAPSRPAPARTRGDGARLSSRAPDGAAPPDRDRPRAAVPRSVLFGLLLGALAVGVTVLGVSNWGVRTPASGSAPPIVAAPLLPAAEAPVGAPATGAPAPVPTQPDAVASASTGDSDPAPEAASATPAATSDAATAAATAATTDTATAATADAAAATDTATAAATDTATAAATDTKTAATADTATDTATATATSHAFAGPEITHEPATGELLNYEALLEVDTPTPSQVFSNGILVGPTGQAHKVRCGLRYVRLGDSPGVWRSEGVTVDVTCGQLTRVRMTLSH